MHRCITLCLLTCPAVPLAESAPKPRGDGTPALYLPTTVGDKRVLESTWGGDTREHTEWVTAVDVAGGLTVVSFAYREGGPAVFRDGASAGGVFHVESGGKVIDPPYRRLKLPAKAGEAWRVDALDLRYTTGEEEVVEVPAGRFKAVRVELRRVMDGDVVYHNTDWYAPGVGVVKAISRDREGDRVTVLKAFIPAAKK